MAASLVDLAAARDGRAVTAYGASPAYAALAVARMAKIKAQAPIVVVVDSDESARQFADDVRFFASTDDERELTIAILPSPGSSPYAEVASDSAAQLERVATLYRLAAGGRAMPDIVVTSTLGLLRRTMPAGALAALGVTLRVGDELGGDGRDGLVARLIAGGFVRVPVVDDPGTLAVRGGVIDLFAPMTSRPIRLELFGDDIESMRNFDPTTQRTLGNVDEVVLHPVRETISTGGGDVRARIRAAADEFTYPSKATRKLISQLEGGERIVGLAGLLPAFHDELVAPSTYIHNDATWVVVDPDAVLRAARDEWQEAAIRREAAIEAGALTWPIDAHYATVEEFTTTLAEPARRITLPSLELTGHQGDAPLRLTIDTLSALRRDLERTRSHNDDHQASPLLTAIRSWRRDGVRVVLAADSTTRRDRLVGLLDANKLGHVEVVSGSPSSGFYSAADLLAVVTSADVFGSRTGDARPNRGKQGRAALRGGVSDFSQLSVGDFVVHQRHGVGRYEGLVKLPLGETTAPGAHEFDFLRLEYDGGTLYLPVFRLGELERFVGEGGHAPKLDKLGGVTWEKTRAKANAQIRALAEELLQIYAQRASLPGFAFPAPDDSYRDFEARFPYAETPDQLAAIDAVSADMESGRAMDRVVCGDVGYGKTEVALRAIFKAIQGGKQAALLAPTTVLVEQHARTLAERFAGTPVNIGKLSRFQTKAEQASVIERLAEGKLDVVVGTHRLLSADVRWRDLGLLVIDEEQRFGVSHKERLRRYRTQLDVLTLTATPIPRTLHLAMTGLRDLSIIATPPADRRAIRTLASAVDDGVIKEAIDRELARGGQIFWITPNIEAERPRVQAASEPGEPPPPPTAPRRKIGEWKEYLERLVPTLRVGVAHGQLGEGALEQVMLDFIDGKLDVLVSTTIVESGLDIPRANTMFVAHADAFGLSQLYQLRGRIGRSKERAYCYLLIPSSEQVSSEARRRLEVLQRFTELGSGFNIASHDLEQRGGGELLGAKQSGSIAAVGFDAYVRMLEAAVADLRGQPIHRAVDPELAVDEPGYIPDDYLPDPGLRLDFYKRLSSADDEGELDAMLAELGDRFGDVPAPVHQLASLMSLKILARNLGVQSLELTRTRIGLGLLPSSPVTAAKAAVLGWRRAPDGRLVKTRIPPPAPVKTAETEANEPVVVDPRARHADIREALLGLLARGT